MRLVRSARFCVSSAAPSVPATPTRVISNPVQLASMMPPFAKSEELIPRQVPSLYACAEPSDFPRLPPVAVKQGRAHHVGVHEPGVIRTKDPDGHSCLRLPGVPTLVGMVSSPGLPGVSIPCFRLKDVPLTNRRLGVVVYRADTIDVTPTP